MIRFVACLSVAVVLSLSSVASAESIDELKEKYLKIGQTIVDMVNSKSVSAGEIEKHVTELTRISVELSNQYKSAYPDGKKLLDIVINQVAKVSGGQVIGVGPMVDLSFDEIEHDWHDLAYFEKNDAGVDLEDEDNEHFTDPLHVMIHPVMVLRAARDFESSQSQDELDAMKGEMEEGMEQVEIVVDALKSS